jgi:hypothetical protein
METSFTPFPALLLQEFYSSEQGLYILQCCRGGIMEALQSIAEIQSQAYILCKGEGQVLEFFPWTVTYHYSSAEKIPESHDVFSMEKTSFWVDFSLRTSCRMKSDAPEMPPEIIASFTKQLASSMSSWSLVSARSFPRQVASPVGIKSHGHGQEFDPSSPRPPGPAYRVRPARRPAFRLRRV